MSKLTRRLVCAGAAALAFGLSLAPAGEVRAQTALKFADGLPKSFAYYGAMEAFKKEAESRSSSLSIQLFGDGVLGDQKAIMEATKVGAIDMSVVASQVAQQLVPEFGMFGLPFVWVNYDDWIKFLRGPVVAEMAKKMEVHGMKVLVVADGGALAVLNSKRPKIGRAHV